MKLKIIITSALVLSSGLVHAAAEASFAPPAAVARWQDARFGMFIHWGPVSLKGTEIGWSRGTQIPIGEYDNLYKQFNPTRFDAGQWVAVAKEAGMKYVVLTTKHHDGFCLWGTKQTDYNIMNSPFHRDVVKELAAACKRAGIAFGTYYSTCDWHHPAFPVGSPGGQSKNPNPDLNAYDAYLRAQVTELIENYGPLFTLWFDVPGPYDATYGEPMVKYVRDLQPDIMINNRAYSVGGKDSGLKHQNIVGDYNTPEQKIGDFQMDRPWETCMTIGTQWSWKPNDRMKSLKDCLQTLIRTNGGNGNLLFNVGPEPGGEIEPRQVQRLKEMGAWLAKNGVAVYGTRGGPWKPANHMVSTRKGDKIYLHILNPSNGEISVPALPVSIKSAQILDGPAIKTNIAGGFLSFEIPSSSWDEIDTIIELTIDGDAMEIEPIRLTSSPGMPGAKASASVIYNNDSKYGAEMALDGDAETRWATPEGTKHAWLQIDFAKNPTFSGVEIEEAYAGNSSRVKKFELQKRDGDSWTTFHSGDGLGTRFKVSFEPVTTSAIRLNILDASEGPTISEMQISGQKK